MLDALVDVMTEKGYAATTVSDVIERAGVSRETFYQQFDSKHDCFEQAFEEAASALLAALDGGEAEPQGSALESFDRLLGRYLALLAANSGLARLFLVEVYAAGAEANRRRARLQQELVDAVAALFSVSDETDRFACEALVAATSAMVTARILAGAAGELPLLRDPLVSLARRMLLPDVSREGSGTA